jgi:prolyl oligopeptidase
LAVSCGSNPEPQRMSYPETRKDNITDEYFGHQVEDPYRWLEDDNSPETAEWVKAQNVVTRGYLDAIPERAAIRQRLEELYNYPRISSLMRVGEYYFFYRNEGLQNQAVIYIQKGRDGEPSVFIDPNNLSEDGTVTVSLMGHSDDDKYIAVSRSEAGSDWSNILVYEVESGRETGDVLKWVKFSGATWFKDGFFYSRYPEPAKGSEYSGENTNHSVYYHKLGTTQSEDILVYENPNAPNMYHWVSKTEDDQYLMLYAAQGTDGYECHYKPLNQITGSFTPLFTGFSNKSSVVDHADGHFLVMTDIDAPNYRLVKINLKNPAKNAWQEIIPESEHLLEGVNTGGGWLFAQYLQDVNTKVYRMKPDGSDKSAIELPAATGSAGGFGAKKDDKTLFYTFTSFTYPSTIFEYDIQTGESKLFFRPELKFNPDDFESKQVFFNSKDGQRLTMFIVHKKGLELNGKNPTYLYGYGGFNVNLGPGFSTSNIAMLERGGVYAMAIIRGGGEYGEEWHKAGMLLNKQNVFDDFIASAEYLIREGYTSSEHLAIAGGSNGGLLVGACMTQRPELFAAAFPAVGVLDMLRYHKFTVGWGWIPEYGCTDSSEVHFKNLLAYSPYHNLKPGTRYPSTMVTTADHDDRVVPAHSFKFAARLQEYHAGDNPVLISISIRAGHGAGKPISKILDEQADVWSFFFNETRGKRKK